MNALEWGRGGIPCVLIHGSGDSAYVWESFASRIAPRFHSVAVDLRGHGDSDWDLSERYDPGTMAKDVAEATATLDLGPMVVIGHSLGGEVALHLSVSHSERVLGLALVDYGPDPNPEGCAHIREELRSTPRTFRTVDEYLSRLIQRHPLAPHHILKRLAIQSLRPNAHDGFETKYDPAAVSEVTNGQISQSSGQSDQQEPWSLLARVRCPTLVVRGAGSSVLSRDVAERMACQVLGNGRLAVVGIAGHCVMIDNPEGFHEAITNLLLKQGGIEYER